MCWGSFLLRRGFQRWCFGSAECTVLCCAGARISVVFGCFACIAEELRFYSVRFVLVCRCKKHLKKIQNLRCKYRKSIFDVF